MIETPWLSLYLDPSPEMHARTARNSRASRRWNIQYCADIIVQRPSEVSFRNLCSPGRMGDYVKRCVSAATVHGNPGVTEILLSDIVTLAHTRPPCLCTHFAIMYSHRSVYTYIYPLPMHCIFVYREWYAHYCGGDHGLQGDALQEWDLSRYQWNLSLRSVTVTNTYPSVFSRKLPEGTVCVCILFLYFKSDTTKKIEFL